MGNADEQGRRFAALSAWAAQAGICLTPCRGKNPEMVGQGCAIAGRQMHADRPPDEQRLFGYDATDGNDR